MPSRFQAVHASAVRNVAKNKKRAEQLLADVRKRSTRMVENAHAVGKALLELSEERIYAAKGYDSFADLLKGEKLMARTTAHRLMSIADTYTLKQVRELGVSKAYALLSYAEATPKLDHAPILLDNNVRIGNKFITAMTVREINEAAKRARKASGRANPQSGPEKFARKEARMLQARLRKQGFDKAKASAVRDGTAWRVQVVVDAEDASELA